MVRDMQTTGNTIDDAVENAQLQIFSGSAPITSGAGTFCPPVPQRLASPFGLAELSEKDEYDDSDDEGDSDEELEDSDDGSDLDEEADDDQMSDEEEDDGPGLFNCSFTPKKPTNFHISSYQHEIRWNTKTTCRICSSGQAKAR